MVTFFTEVDGVVFCESTLEGKLLGELRELGSTQNTTLSDLKKQMAVKAKQLGGNAIINFKYVQKADRGLHLLKWDKERLNCTGQVIVLLNHPGKDSRVLHDQESKKCHSCSEFIRADAAKCRFCGENT